MVDPSPCVGSVDRTALAGWTDARARRAHYSSRRMTGAIQQPLPPAHLDMICSDEVAPQSLYRVDERREVGRCRDIVSIEKAQVAPTSLREARIPGGQES